MTVDISAEGLRLRSAILPRVDEHLTCNIRGVGSVGIRIVWAGACDFTVRVVGSSPTPGEVARRLLDLARGQARSPDVVRVARRITPARTAVTITLADGTGLPARILNLSASGVALQLDAPLAIGQAVTIGRHRATVARHLADGVGVAFDMPLDEQAIHERTVL